jgi:PAS domain S-box-containing protein/putative nucleotidyltransferase with HDIG domain
MDFPWQRGPPQDARRAPQSSAASAAASASEPRDQRLILRALADGADGPVFSVDRSYRYTSFNTSHAAAMKALYGAEIVLGRSILDYQTVDEDRHAARKHLDRALAGEKVAGEVFSGEDARSRRCFAIRHDPIKDDGSVIGVMVQVLDVTERREAEESRREGEERYRELVEHLTSGVIVYEPIDGGADFAIREVNAAAQRIEGLTRAELVGRSVTDAFPSVEEFGLLDVLRRVSITGATECLPTTLYQDQRLSTWRENEVYRLPSGEVVAVYEDVTERVRSEQALAHAKAMLDFAEELGREGGWEYDVESRRVTWTQEVYRIYGVDNGYDPNDVSVDIGFYAPESAPRVAEAFKQAVESGEPYDLIAQLDRADGERIWVRTIGRPIVVDGLVVRVAGNIVDITEGKQAEENLSAAARQWRETFDAMSDSVTLLDHEGKVLRCNAATAALVGRSYNDIVGRRCHEVFHDTHELHPLCPQRGARESGEARSSIIEQDGRWLRVTYSPELADGLVVGGVHVVSDVTDMKQTEDRLRDSVAKHERITEGVIAALSRSVEVRDPYTSGHERRVSELATAMAQELGLADESVRCVRVAGMLHDIGKIVVPAEILAKPGRLSENEFELIKAHPQAAYEILGPIEFEGPVADVAVQHHERLDGSGYPAGLTGESILPEALILAVADVVEAMISHRPYRAALPFDSAMAELEEGAGSRYDAAACDAAISLFREKGFVFSE